MHLSAERSSSASILVCSCVCSNNMPAPQHASAVPSWLMLIGFLIQQRLHGSKMDGSSLDWASVRASGAGAGRTHAVWHEARRNQDKTALLAQALQCCDIAQAPADVSDDSSRPIYNCHAYIGQML